MGVISALKRAISSTIQSAQLLAEIREGVANSAELTRRQFVESRRASGDAEDRNEKLLKEIRDNLKAQNAILARIAEQLGAKAIAPVATSGSSYGATSASTRMTSERSPAAPPPPKSIIPS